MSDDVGAVAPAASEPVAEVADAEVVHTPNAITTEAPVKPPSIDDALDRAEAKVKSDAKDTPAPVKSEAKTEKPEPKAEVKAEKSETKAVKTEAKTEPVKSEVKRDEGGKFASDRSEAKTERPVSDAPARFSEDAKAIWKDAPEPIRRETERAIKELTDGHGKYKQAAERDAGLNEFHEMAAKGGTDVKTALTKYVGLENMLRQDFPKGMAQICENYGTSLRDFAAKVLNQTPEEQTSQSDATIRELKQQVAALTEQVGGVTKTFETQRHETTHAEVTKFASDPAHSRFDELADDIAFFLKTRCPGDLTQAYELAERLNPAPAKAKEDPASTAIVDLQAQTQKGSKSINGAPGNGSSPTARKSSKTLDESLDRAFAALG